ncbi:MULTISPECIES: MMPL family transporter [unclassified Nocardiopsis]|uniref:MMPL family transporter n=1 Tax=unclassified Nocardiopsis TaxID=2649073 RepID=UPI0013575F82|nr:MULTISPECIES: MMPL family transporter [unclassified Nocardiopsis]
MDKDGRRSRWWIGAALLVTLLWLAGAGPLGAFLGRLGEVQTNDPSAFLPAGAESTEVSAIVEEFDREEAVPAAVVYSREDGEITREELADIGAVAERVGGQAWVSGTVTGPLPGTEDPSVAQFVVPIGSEEETGEAVEQLRALLADDPVPGLRAQVTGPAGYAADLSAAFAGIDSTLLAVAVVAVLVILVAVYRSPLLPVLVVLACLLALGLAGALVYLAADTGLVSLNGQSQGILFILVVGACTDYALLLVARYREELAARERVPSAVLAAVRGVAGPVLASGGTVILGLLCLLAADLTSTRGLGPVVAIGVVAALLSAMTFLPAVLALCGRAAFWPVPPHGSREAAGSLAEVVGRHRFWGRVATAVSRRPRLYWIATTAVLAAAAVFAPQFDAGGTGQAEVFRTEVEAVRAQEVLDRGFGSDAGAAPALVVADADRLDEVVRAAERLPRVEEAAPVTEPGPPGAEAPPLEEDGRVLVEAVLTVGPESPEALDAVRDLRAELRAVEGADALVGGVTATDLDTLETAQRDFTVVVPLVLGAVFLVLIPLLRSLVAPLLLMAANVLSFAAALGVGALVFDHLLGLPGADPVVPLFAFVFLVALGVDYSIFLMSRAREEALEHGHREGVLRALTVTGGVITSAGVVLAVTFAALAVIPLLFLLQLAFLVAFGVLVDALLVRTLLVPALSLDAGPRVWWPGRAGAADGGSAPEAERRPQAVGRSG